MEELIYLELNLPHCHYIYHKSHMDWPSITIMKEKPTQKIWICTSNFGHAEHSLSLPLLVKHVATNGLNCKIKIVFKIIYSL
jgi:hypothetical protein